MKSAVPFHDESAASADVRVPVGEVIGTFEWYPRGLTPLSVTVDARCRVSQPFSGELLAYRRAGSTKDTP